jgi:hypothetical protein
VDSGSDAATGAVAIAMKAAATLWVATPSNGVAVSLPSSNPVKHGVDVATGAFFRRQPSPGDPRGR